MLQIRLKRGTSAESGGGPKPVPVDTVTVACPDHLVLAELPVAKSLGAPTTASLVKNVGRKSRRQLGERVHFCVRCDFPIAVYGRLNPCEHVFCLDCAISDSICYLCDERIQKIQTIKMMEGIFVCAAPHCLKSFLKRADFESHILETHADLIHPNAEREDRNESEAASAKQSTASESTARAPLRPAFSPSINTLPDDKSRRQQPRDQPPLRPILQQKPPGQFPFFGQVPNHPSESQSDNNRPPGFGGPGPHNPFLQQSFDSQGSIQQPSGQIPDKPQGNLSESPYPEYLAMHTNQPANYPMPVNTAQGMTHPPFNYPPFPTDGSQPFYNVPYEIARTDSAPEVGSEQGSLLGFPPNQAGATNFPANYPQPWNMAQPSPGVGDGFTHMSDPQGRATYFQGDYGRNLGGFPSNLLPQPITSKGMETMQGGNALDSRDEKGILAPQPLQLVQAPLPPPQLSQLKRGQYHSGEMGHDGQSMGWQHEKRDSFGNGRDS